MLAGARRLQHAAASSAPAAAAPLPTAAPSLRRPRPFCSAPGGRQPLQLAAAAGPRRARRALLAAAPLLPLAAARRSVVAMAAASDSSHDLLIVGPGVLGSHLGVLWREAFPGATVVAQTNSDTNHAKLRELGLSPVTRDASPAGKRYPYVLFAAPPSGSEDYPAAVRTATEQWDGSGSFVFTGSMSVCATEDGSTVDENCPLVAPGKSPSTDRLLGAEAAALGAGGNVLRLVGLYHAQRGPHTFFIRQGEVARYGGYTVNMLHYEDAARLALAILRGDGAPPDAPRYRGRVFVGTDGRPLTFTDMVDACAASGLFGPSVAVRFTAGPEAGGLGKVVTNAATAAQLGGWQPKYPGFRDFFLSGGGRDWYNSSSEAAAKAAVGAPHQ